MWIVTAILDAILNVVAKLWERHESDQSHERLGEAQANEQASEHQAMIVAEARRIEAESKAAHAKDDSDNAFDAYYRRKDSK